MQPRHPLRFRGPLALLLLAGCASTPTTHNDAPSAAPTATTSAATKPLTAPTFTTEPWIYEGKTGRQINTPSYHLYTTTDQPALLDKLPAFLEAAMAHYRSTLGELPAPPGPLDSYLLANRPQWARFTQRLMGDRAEPFLRIQRGGFATRGQAVLYDVGVRDTFSLASHEGWHQYTQRTFQQSLPVWLEEGIATYMEGFRWDQQNAGQTGGVRFLPWTNLERFDQLRAMQASHSLMSIRELLSTSPQELLGAGRLKQTGSDAALTYYAQVWSLIHFLHEGAGGKYREELATLLSDAARGRLDQRLLSAGGSGSAQMYMNPRRGPEFFRLALHADLAQVQTEYDAFVAKVVEPGSKQKIVAGESPINK